MNTTNIKNGEQEYSKRSTWSYTLLLFFFGGLGIHRFYLAKTGTGVLYLFTGGVLGIGTLVDYLAAVFSTPRDSDGRSLRPEVGARIFLVLMFLLGIIGVFMMIFGLGVMGSSLSDLDV